MRYFVFFLATLCYANQVHYPERVPVYEGREGALSSELTIITSTSFIPSHPATYMIERTQKSLEITPEFRGCHKIIVCDGLNEKYRTSAVDDINTRKERYNIYKKRLYALCKANPAFANTTLIFLEKNYTLSGAIEVALEYVKTPYIFLHQHDFEHIRRLKAVEVIASMKRNPNLKHIRVPSERNVSDYWDGPIDRKIEGGALIPLCRTFRWCDSEHFSSVKYYLDFVLPRCRPNYGFMEHCIHQPDFVKGQIKIRQNHLLYGTYKYGKKGDGNYTSHLDGRNI
ncbi:MAG: hypothetical protein MRY21_00790 [Simkaniaceae bacterium]|nr:hypothetical protein [Simkaniaceae bacterium]